MKMQEFIGEQVYSKSDGKGQIAKVIGGKNTYFQIQFENGKQKTYRIPRAFLSGILSTENVELNKQIEKMPDVEVKANDDLASAKELGISISKKCALTSKNLAILGALDDFYGLYFKIYSEFTEAMVEFTKMQMEKTGEPYDGSIQFHLTPEMENNARKHFIPVLNRNVGLFTNEYETFMANKSEFRNFPYYIIRGYSYCYATFQEFCQAVEQIYIDMIYKWKKQINPNVRIEDIENQVNTRLQILTAIKEKEIFSENQVDEQVSGDETLYLVEALPMISCYQQKHDIVARKYQAKLFNGTGTIILPTHYCTACKKYFIGDKTLKEYENQYGKILVRRQKYLTQKQQESVFDKFDPESRLHQYGYNVKADGMTDLERQRILIALIESKRVTYYEICRTIEQCINLFQSQAKYSQAVTKWKRDLKFIGDYVKMVSQ